MRIYVAGSFHFAKEMMQAMESLKAIGHAAIVPLHTEDCCNEPNFKPELEDSLEKELEIGLRDDVLRCCFNDISGCDAIVVINHSKNGVQGYLGTSVLMELAVAFHAGKRIYLLNDIDKNQKYAPEVLMMQPQILGGELREEDFQ